MKHKKDWKKVKQFIPVSALDDHTKLILDGYRRFFEAHEEAEVIDMDVFRSLFFGVWNKTLPSEAANAYMVLLDRCCEDVMPEQRATIVNSLIELELATELGNKLMSYEAGEEVDLIPTIMRYTEVAKKKLEIVSTAAYATIASLKEKRKSSKQYQWYLPGIARHCRKLEGGDMVIIAALTDVGKTSFALTNVVAFSCQTTYPWLWFNNEGPKERIQRRAYGMMLGVGTDQIQEWEDDDSLGERIFNIYGRHDPIRIYDIHGMNTMQLEDLIARVEEECGGVGGVVWDMLDAVTFRGSSTASRTDQVLEEKYAWARQLGVEKDFPNIATSQQSENKDWQQWPAKHELKESKNGKQGACDMLIYVTQPPEAAKELFRYISAPKNKLALPTMPRMQLACRFDKVLGVIKEESFGQ